MKIKLPTFLLLAFSGIVNFANAQLYNNGGIITVQNGAYIMAMGDIKNTSGTITNDGKIEVQGKRIQFSQLLSTKMACNKKSIEKIIAEQISGNIVSYYFKDSKLYLYLPDDNLLVFKKPTQQ